LSPVGDGARDSEWQGRVERLGQLIGTRRRSGIGASCPFPWVLTNVPSPNPQQPFAAGDGTGASVNLAPFDFL
jgi:hypothetical protein